eukprot:GEMP01083017.1.p1 GENE.GEMP01083017.1~~GEMP01083017.1.p1  ORF type:complete len:247 (+),score=22.99 GEMP01083017.1:78-743(+)
MFALLFFAVATTEGPCDAAHDASKCRIANDVVDDCCAGETEGPTCARGYEYSRGNNTSNCLAPYLLVTCCIPSALFTPTTTTTTSTTTSSTITISSTTTTSFTTTSTAATTTTTATTTTSACAGLRRRKCRRNASCRWTKRHMRNRRHRRRKGKCVGKPEPTSTTSTTSTTSMASTTDPTAPSAGKALVGNTNINVSVIINNKRHHIYRQQSGHSANIAFA